MAIGKSITRHKIISITITSFYFVYRNAIKYICLKTKYAKGTANTGLIMNKTAMLEALAYNTSS